MTLETALMVGGGLFQAVGQISSANQQAAAQEANAAAARDAAKASMDAATAEAEQRARIMRGKIGEASAAYGASGVTMEGSSLLKIVDLASEAELDRQMTLYRGKSQARAQNYQAAIDDTSADNTRAGGYMKAGETLLGTTSKYGKKAGWF